MSIFEFQIISMTENYLASRSTLSDRKLERWLNKLVTESTLLLEE